MVNYHLPHSLTFYLTDGDGNCGIHASTEVRLGSLNGVEIGNISIRLE